MTEAEYDPKRELKLHDPFVLPDELELEHEIERPRWWYAQQLRLAGASWAEAARALGYNDGSTAYSAVTRHSNYELENAKDMIKMELERLDMLQLVIWRKARAGSIKDIETVLKIMQMRAKYLGIDDIHYGENDDERNSGVIIIGGDTEEYLKGIQQHKAPVEGEVAS